MAVDTAPRSARQHCDTHSVDYLGLPKAAYERLKRKKESLLLLSMIQDTDADVGDEELDVVGMLLARGGDVNARDPKSLRSLLSSASARGHVKLVRLLLIRGAPDPVRATWCTCSCQTRAK